MGNLWIALSAAIKYLGGEIVIPPYTNKKTLSIGTKHSPEAVCLPYKLVLGNYIQAIESGAEALIMIRSPGLCRLGQYSDITKTALIDLGYDIEFIDFDLYTSKFIELYAGFKRATGNNNPIDLINAVRLSVKKMRMLDKVDEIAHYYRPREAEQGSSDKWYRLTLAEIDKALTVKECREVYDFVRNEAGKIKIDRNREIINIDVTGEIYVVLDAFANMEMEKELGKLGVQVRRHLSVSSWIDRILVPSLLSFSETHGEKASRYAKDYLRRDIGGDAIESIGDTAYAAESNADGIIHLLPFTCMPEIIAQNILPNIRNDKDIPFLSLVLDEFTGRAGFITRLEAFVDLTRRRKKNKQLLSA